VTGFGRGAARLSTAAGIDLVTAPAVAARISDTLRSRLGRDDFIATRSGRK